MLFHALMARKNILQKQPGKALILTILFSLLQQQSCSVQIYDPRGRHCRITRLTKQDQGNLNQTYKFLYNLHDTFKMRAWASTQSQSAQRKSCQCLDA